MELLFGNRSVVISSACSGVCGGVLLTHSELSLNIELSSAQGWIGTLKIFGRSSPVVSFVLSRTIVNFKNTILKRKGSENGVNILD